jgi:hypothetical protein
MLRVVIKSYGGLKNGKAILTIATNHVRGNIVSTNVNRIKDARNKFRNVSTGVMDNISTGVGDCIAPRFQTRDAVL